MAPTRRREHSPPVAEPVDQPDLFASDFDVHDFEDWLRLLCWVETVEPAGDGETRAGRRKAASIVMPRSSVPRLIHVLRYSVGHYKSERHS